MHWALVAAAGVSAHLVLDLNYRIGASRGIPGVEDGSSSLSKRELPLANARQFYYTTLQIGTPPQNVSVIVDTGSSDLWVPQPGAAEQCSSPVHCYNNTEFSIDNSTTFKQNNTDFDISYRDGTVAQGFWGTDALGVGDWQVENASLAIGTFSNTTMGILGLGMEAFESTITGTIDGELQGGYSNLPMLLKEQGLINSLSYSLSLGKVDEKGGALIFGGIDHASYSGQLYKVPLVRTYDSQNPITTSIMLHGICAQGKPLLHCSIPVLIDSGTSINYMPGPFVEAIAAKFNASWSADSSAYIIDCNTNTSLDINMSGIEVNIPGSQNIPLYNQTGQPLYQDGIPMCMLPFRPSDSSFILGVSTLRSLYLSFDYENGEVAIAQYVPNEDTDIEQISTDGIPSALEAPSYSSTQSTTSYSLELSVSHIKGIASDISLTSLDAAFTTLSSSSSGSGIQTASILQASEASSASSNYGKPAPHPEWSNFVALIISYLI